MNQKNRLSILFSSLVVAIFLAGCAAETPAPTATPIVKVVTATSTPAPPTPTVTIQPSPTPTDTPTPIPPTPTPAASLTITSLPAGSEVFVASVDELGITLHDEKGESAVARRLKGFNRLSAEDASNAFSGVIDEKYRLGVTPLLLPLEPGNYVVFLAIPKGVATSGGNLFDDGFEDDSTYGPSMVGFSGGRKGRAYLVEAVENEPRFLTQLWQPRAASLDEIEPIYPEEETFEFDEKEIEDALTGNLPTSDIPVILRLLRKGGKVVYREDENHRILIEINPATGVLDTLLRFEN